MGNQTIDFEEGMKIGLGYNRLTGDFLPSPAVQGTSISAVPGATGQQVTLDCSTIKDVETLHKSIGVSVDGGGSYMGFSANVKVDYLNTCDFSSFSTYVLVHVSVQDAFESIDSPVFSSDASELLVNGNPDRFRRRFGDNYISGIKKGGEYFAIYQITGSDESEKESLGVSVHAAFNGLIGSAELNTTIQTATSTSKSHLEVQIHTFRQGAIGTADLNLEDIMKTARQFPVDVSGDKAYPYAVLLQDYDALKSPNDQFDYYQIKQQQDVLQDLATKRFEFLTLRDDLKYILKHSDDFQNADSTPVNRDELSKIFDDVVNTINTMQKLASACSQDAHQCEFPTFEAAKIKLPIAKPRAPGSDDALVARGKVIAEQYPLAVELRNQQTDEPSQRGFDIGMAVAEKDTAPGSGKQAIHDSLDPTERRGFEIAVQFSLERNRRADLVAMGAAVAKVNPIVAKARDDGPNAFYRLGFDIATGLYGDPALGALGYTAEGPGALGIHDSLEADGQSGFNDSMKLHLGPPPLPRRV